MKYSAKQYAAALVAAVRGKSSSEQKEVMRRFFLLILRHGLWSRRALIIKEVKRQYLKELGMREVLVSAPEPLNSGTRKEIKRVIGKNIFWQEAVEPELLAGLKILIDEEVLIDASGKTQLDKLFGK
jgi:F0F1-type ATP synthase delta subunit